MLVVLLILDTFFGNIKIYFGKEILQHVVIGFRTFKPGARPPKASCGPMLDLLKLFSEKCVYVCVYVCMYEYLFICTHMSKTL